MIVTSVTKRKPLAKKKPRESLPDSPPFTLESLRRLLSTNVIGPKQMMPGDVEIAELARILNGWQAHYLIEQNTRPLRELQRDACAALTTLADVFRQLCLPRALRRTRCKTKRHRQSSRSLENAWPRSTRQGTSSQLRRGFRYGKTRRLPRIAGNGLRTFCQSILKML